MSHTAHTSLDVLSIFIISTSQNRMPYVYRYVHETTLANAVSSVKNKQEKGRKDKRKKRKKNGSLKLPHHEDYFSHSLTPCNIILVSYREANEAVWSSMLETATKARLVHLGTSFPLKNSKWSYFELNLTFCKSVRRQEPFCWRKLP